MAKKCIGPHFLASDCLGRVTINGREMHRAALPSVRLLSFLSFCARYVVLLVWFVFLSLTPWGRRGEGEMGSRSDGMTLKKTTGWGQDLGILGGSAIIHSGCM